MDKLPKEIIQLIGVNLDLPNLLKLCVSDKRFSKDICNNRDFWRNKLINDYPEYKNRLKNFPFFNIPNAVILLRNNELSDEIKEDLEEKYGYRVGL